MSILSGRWMLQGIIGNPLNFLTRCPQHLCPAHEDERLHPAKPLKLHVAWGPLCVCLVKMEVPRRIKEKIMPVLEGGCVYEMVRVKTTQNTIPIWHEDIIVNTTSICFWLTYLQATLRIWYDMKTYIIGKATHVAWIVDCNLVQNNKMYANKKLHPVLTPRLYLAATSPP